MIGSPDWLRQCRVGATIGTMRDGDAGQRAGQTAAGLRFTLAQTINRAIVGAARMIGDPAAVAVAPMADPYPAYARIRKQGVLRRSRLGVWVTPDHALVSQVLRD